MRHNVPLCGRVTLASPHYSAVADELNVAMELTMSVIMRVNEDDYILDSCSWFCISEHHPNHQSLRLTFDELHDHQRKSNFPLANYL